MAVVPALHAEGTPKRWRIGFGMGAFNMQGEVPSDGANQLTVVDTFGNPTAVYTDPRQDSLFFATLEVQGGGVAQLNGQYAFGRRFVLEGSLGHGRADVGDVEVQVLFDSDANTTNFGANYRAYRIPVGTLRVTPLQLSAIGRFRPQKKLNPYVGGGVGYQFASVDTDPAFDTFSANLDAATGFQAEILPATPGLPPVVVIPPFAPAEDLEGASVDAPDAFTWHLLAGVEYAWSSHWALIVDLRHVWTDEALSIGFNGGEDLGIAVPQSTVSEDSPLADGTYGPIRVRSGGLLDGGRVVPGPNRPEDSDCAQFPTFCIFDATQPDGVPDPGLYYVNGGKIDYEAITFTIGVRYTFD